MIDLGIVTSTRADFGLLLPIIIELRKHESENLHVSLIVTGTHLQKSFGYTIQEIEDFKCRIDEKVEISIISKDCNDMANSQADAIVKFTELFNQKRYSAICVLGDRYEMLMVSIAATNVRIPIFHICGGDTTEGVLDECYRHSITKMSYLHFTTNEKSRMRVIQMGENPLRVYDVGSTSVDNIMNMKLLSRNDVLKTVGLQECKYVLGTYHPATLESENPISELMAFLKVISLFPQMEFIITKANADKGGKIINELLEREEKNISNLHVFSSLGVLRYYSLMKYSEFVIGNSSSGIVEAPMFGIPTVNIGSRQKGRLQCKSIINCNTDENSIYEAINSALNLEFKEACTGIICPYGDGHASERITDIILKVLAENNIDLKKKFYDLELKN